jgi:hypothetical protein
MVFVSKSKNLEVILSKKKADFGGSRWGKWSTLGRREESA